MNASGVKEKKWTLNSTRGRGRWYGSMLTYPEFERLRTICRASVARARMVDPAMPDMDPTHLLTLYYAKERKMGWHRDEGSNDGKSEQPVVSLSVGNTCEFHVKHDAEEG